MKTKSRPSGFLLLRKFHYDRCLPQPTAIGDFYCLKKLPTIRLLSDLKHSQ